MFRRHRPIGEDVKFAEVSQDLPHRPRIGDECDEPDVAAAGGASSESSSARRGLLSAIRTKSVDGKPAVLPGEHVSVEQVSEPEPADHAAPYPLGDRGPSHAIKEDVRWVNIVAFYRSVEEFGAISPSRMR